MMPVRQWLGTISYREQQSHGLTADETKVISKAAKQSPERENKKNKNFWMNYQSRAVVLMREKEKRIFDEE